MRLVFLGAAQRQGDGVGRTGCCACASSWAPEGREQGPQLLPGPACSGRRGALRCPRCRACWCLASLTWALTDWSASLRPSGRAGWWWWWRGSTLNVSPLLRQGPAATLCARLLAFPLCAALPPGQPCRLPPAQLPCGPATQTPTPALSGVLCREHLISLGCEVRFGSKVEDVVVQGGRLAGVRLAGGAWGGEGTAPRDLGSWPPMLRPSGQPCRAVGPWFVSWPCTCPALPAHESPPCCRAAQTAPPSLPRAWCWLRATRRASCTAPCCVTTCASPPSPLPSASGAWPLGPGCVHRGMDGEQPDPRNGFCCPLEMSWLGL